MGKFHSPPTVMADLEIDSGTLSVDATNNRVGIGVTDPDSTLEVFSTATQMKLSYDGSNSCTIAVGSTGDLVITPSGGDTTLKSDFIILDENSSDKLVQFYDDGDDGVMAGYANNAVTLFLHANDESYFPPQVISHGAAMGGAGVHSKMVVRKTSITDNSATNVVTFTVPNANHAAAVRVMGVANFDGCSYAQSFSFEGTIARASGSPTDKAFTAVTVKESAGITPNFTVAVAGSGNTGGNSAEQTFTMQLTINTSNSAASNATFLVELINFNATGISMAAA